MVGVETIDGRHEHDLAPQQNGNLPNTGDLQAANYGAANKIENEEYEDEGGLGGGSSVGRIVHATVPLGVVKDEDAEITSGDLADEPGEGEGDEDEEYAGHGCVVNREQGGKVELVCRERNQGKQEVGKDGAENLTGNELDVLDAALVGFRVPQVQAAVDNAGKDNQARNA